MEIAETLALLQATEKMLDRFDQKHRFTAADICSMHRAWPGDIYPWASKYRQVMMMSKSGFPFAAPAYIPQLMTGFEKESLARHTPCAGDDSTIALSLAIVHIEMVLIHAFREGNGRLARLLAIRMGLQAGLPMLIFDGMEGERREAYFAAVRAGAGQEPADGGYFRKDYRAEPGGSAGIKTLSCSCVSSCAVILIPSTAEEERTERSNA